MHGTAVWAVRDGPSGPRVRKMILYDDEFADSLRQSLCNNCGLVYERDKRLPPWAKNLHAQDPPLGPR